MGEAKHRGERPAGRRHSWWVTAAGLVLLIVGTLGLHPRTDPVTAARISGSPSALSAGAEDGPVIAQLEPGSPRLVRIPALGISSRVVPIRAAHRTLVPPSDPQLLGWWADGAKPGASRGSAVMTGHTVHTGGGALDDLESLHSGDQIVVRTDQDSLRYVVRRVRTYDKDAFEELAPEAFNQDVRGRLVLVTCEDWNGESYLSNVVVTATPGTSHRIRTGAGSPPSGSSRAGPGSAPEGTANVHLTRPR